MRRWWGPLCTRPTRLVRISLKQRSADRHVIPLWHIILIQSQSVFALSPKYCVLSGEATNINFIVFGLIQPELELTIYRNRGKHANNYITDTVEYLWYIIRSESYSDLDTWICFSIFVQLTWVYKCRKYRFISFLCCFYKHFQWTFRT